MHQVQSGVQEPRRKKGRAESNASISSNGSQSLVQICHEVAQALLAVAGDACCILQWSCGAAPAVATFELAHALMQWTNEPYTARPGMLESTIYHVTAT